MTFIEILLIVVALIPLACPVSREVRAWLTYFEKRRSRRQPKRRAAARAR